ncbi:O-antigen ligase family protein [Geomonas oryzae]|uniref:O-antigen ligase family protein n=1 Tax=Geomonas oryzae TaxID=2364273 RepID=UPI00100B720A|nr:O-antigen ligase family protein [Geomonas oryzae]
MNTIGLALYLLFMISWFLHLTSRIPWLGAIRFDLVLVLLLFLIHMLQKRTSDAEAEPYRKLRALVFTVIVLTPFAQWPGSVVHYGLINFLKGIVFFYFTIWFVKTQKQLLLLVTTFVLCQSFRIFEPVYLHVTEGYWGSRASIAGWEFMERLSGAPYDVINPNGLAYVILTVIPFLIMLFEVSKLHKLLAIAIMPLSLYALTLTGSRSGFVGLVIIAAAMLWLSKRKMVHVILIGLGAILILSFLNEGLKDRYRSLYDTNSRNSATVEGRLTGLKNNFAVGMRRPLFGHGIGTSTEANANFGDKAKPAHNIFLETFQELGLIGLIALVIYLRAVFREIFKADALTTAEIPTRKISAALAALAVATFFFGFASYGLSSYEWYFIGGCAVCANLTSKRREELSEVS